MELCQATHKTVHDMKSIHLSKVTVLFGGWVLKRFICKLGSLRIGYY